MTLTELFARLRVPLVNQRWSWGGVRQEGAVFLRVWTDEIKVINGRRCVRLINRKVYAGDENLGFSERCEHVDMLAKGAPGYAILCRAVEPLARSREIASFDALTLFKLGALHVLDGDEWAELVDRVRMRQV